MREGSPRPHAKLAYVSASSPVSVLLTPNGVRTDLEIFYEALEERDEVFGLSDVSRDSFLEEIFREH